MDKEVVIKKRVPKGYRIEDIDNYLRKKRSKGEAKLLGEAKSCGVKTPIIYDIVKDESAIVMEKILGTPVKEIFEGSKTSNIL